MKPIARITSYTGNVVHLQDHRPEIVRVGDVFAASWMDNERYGGEDAPLRRGRVQVSGIREDGAFIVSPDLASAIPAVCAGEFGDWLYRVDAAEPRRDRASICPLCGAPTPPPVSVGGALVSACPCVPHQRAVAVPPPGRIACVLALAQAGAIAPEVAHSLMEQPIAAESPPVRYDVGDRTDAEDELW